MMQISPNCITKFVRDRLLTRRLDVKPYNENFAARLNRAEPHHVFKSARLRLLSGIYFKFPSRYISLTRNKQVSIPMAHTHLIVPGLRYIDISCPIPVCRQQTFSVTNASAELILPLDCMHT